MTNFYCLPQPDSKQTMINLDNLLYATDFQDSSYGNRTVMKLVFVGGIELIVDGDHPYELYKKFTEHKN